MPQEKTLYVDYKYYNTNDPVPCPQTQSIGP